MPSDRLHVHLCVKIDCLTRRIVLSVHSHDEVEFNDYVVYDHGAEVEFWDDVFFEKTADVICKLLSLPGEASSFID